MTEAFAAFTAFIHSPRAVLLAFALGAIIWVWFAVRQKGSRS
jgi:hypothetical protein